MSIYRDAIAMAREHTLPELVESQAELARMKAKYSGIGATTPPDLLREIDTTDTAIHLKEKGTT